MATSRTTWQHAGTQRCRKDLAFAAGPQLNQVTSSGLGTTHTSAIAADLQGLGRPNVAIVSFGTINLGLFDADGNPSWTGLDTGLSGTRTIAPTLVTADLNDDGSLDLIAPGEAGISILMGQGFGRFKAPQLLLQAELGGRDPQYSLLTVLEGGKDERDQILVAGSDSGAVYRLGFDDATQRVVIDSDVLQTRHAVAAFDTDDINGDGSDDLVLWDNVGRQISVLNGPDFASSLSWSSDTIAAADDVALGVAALDSSARANIILASRSGTEVAFTNIRQRAAGDGFDTIEVSLPGTVAAERTALLLDIGDFDARSDNARDIVIAAGSTAWAFQADPAVKETPTIGEPITINANSAAILTMNLTTGLGALGKASDSSSGGGGDDLLVIDDTGRLLPFYALAGSYELADPMGLYDFPCIAPARVAARWSGPSSATPTATASGARMTSASPAASPSTLTPTTTRSSILVRRPAHPPPATARSSSTSSPQAPTPSASASETTARSPITHRCCPPPTLR